MKSCEPLFVDAVQLRELHVAAGSGVPKLTITYSMLSTKHCAEVGHGNLPTGMLSRDSLELLKQLVQSIEADMVQYLGAAPPAPVPEFSAPPAPDPRATDRTEEESLNDHIRQPGSI